MAVLVVQNILVSKQRIDVLTCPALKLVILREYRLQCFVQLIGTISSSFLSLTHTIPTLWEIRRITFAQTGLRNPRNPVVVIHDTYSIDPTAWALHHRSPRTCFNVPLNYIR